MNKVDQWEEVDRYFAAVLVPSDPDLDAAIAANHAEGLPAHDVSRTQGKLLHLLVRIQQAGTVLEIGTLGGYSTLWLALARPGTLIVGDNVVRNGAVADPRSDHPNVLGVRGFLEEIGRQPRLSATAVQTVGMKGYDGFVMALVLPP